MNGLYLVGGGEFMWVAMGNLLWQYVKSMNCIVLGGGIYGDA